MSEHLLGAVLAGGRSRRLGRDKASERIGEESLLERAVAVLRNACDEVVVVSARPDTPAGDWRVIPDLRSAGAPLCGIEAALAQAAERGLDGVFVLACDLPLVDADVVAAVIAGLGDADAAAPLRDGPPGVEPLCAAYRTACLAVVSGLLDAGELAAAALFDRVRGVRLDLGSEPFLNVNSEADLARARSQAAI